MARLDPHSYADDTQPRTRSFDWTATVDFEARVLHAEVTLQFVAPATGGVLDLDTRALVIDAVTGPDGAPLPHTLHAPDRFLGSRLEIRVPEGAKLVRIRYRTSPEASALQWLTPEQTLGKKHPYLFSQCQAIHARSIVPCQDTPSFRQTYTAEIDVPSDLRAVMAAAPASASVEREVRGNRVVERFVMPQPIPPYLFAFAVGELAARDLSARSRVWTEPAQLEAAAWEFADVEAQMASAESLLGPYDWERFDLLVLPPSFPFGGMENPRLTFLTPTLLAGDRSLVNVVAHELAHSWTGNLVTNVNAEHFWLNEGFTVFAERRILEAIEGPEMGALHAAVGFQKLLQAIEQHREHPELTRLRTHLDGVDPDQAFSLIPYEKGYLFLKTLEAAAGRSAFDALLAAWLSEHRFGAADTDAFLVLVERMVPGLLGKVDADAWVNRAGLPSTYWKPESARLDAVQAVQQRVPTAEESKGWTAIEWHLYLEALPRPAPTELCASLDAAHSLSTARNPEVRVSWLTLACASGNAAVLPHVEELLGRVGRIKYLKPLYGALAGRPETAALARTLFSRYRSAYHPIAQEVIAALLA